MKDTPQNHSKAAQLLEEFEETIRSLGKTSATCQYNINYSLRGQAAAWVDSLNLAAALATEREGGEGYVQRASVAVDGVLRHPSAFRPLTQIVREKNKESKQTGWNYLVRRQSERTVEVQRTVVQFPPA